MKRDEVLRNGSVSASIKYLSGYEVRGERDTTEGKGGTYLIGYFTDKVSADKAAAKKGVWDHPGPIYPVELVEISFSDGSKAYYPNQPIELINITNEELKARALEKLTPEDKRVLGLDG